MPVVTIQALPPEESARVDELLSQVVGVLASALETTPSNVWANFSPMAQVREGDSAHGQSGYHPIVTVLANPRPDALIHAGLHAVAKAVASGLEIPLERVWIHWVTLNPGQVFADGAVK
jgi:hypothetical protein